MKPAWIWLIVAVAPLGTAFAQRAPETVDQRIQERIQACMQLPITERNGCLDKLSQRVKACTKLPITEQFGCLDKLSLDAAIGPLSNPEARASTIPDPAQLKQAPQDREKVEKPMRELTAELAQVKQQLQEEGGKPGEPPATDVSQTAQGTSRENPTTIATNTAVELEPGIAANNSDTARLLARATLFLNQGNVITARRFLELAAEKGSAPATFALAETYDPAVLATWGTIGIQGDPAKARDLYQKALAGGVQEATDRLKSLRREEIANPPRR